MHHDKIVPQAFMLLSREMREHIAKVFGISRNGITEIRDDQVISDGRTQDDLLVITAGRMADYVGSEESFGRLWELTIAKAKHELYPPVGEIKAIPKDETATQFYDDTMKLDAESAKQLAQISSAGVVTDVVVDSIEDNKIITKNTNAKAKKNK